MDKNSIIKWLLIAGAAYLVYRYLQSSGYLSGASTTSLPQPSTGTALPQTSTVVQTQQPTTGVSVPAPSPALPPAVTAQDVAASLTAVPGFSYWGLNNESGATTQNAWAWNYYWQRASLYDGRFAGPAELGVPTDLQMTLDDYSQRVYNLLFASSTGISGLLMLPPPAFAAAWKM